MKYFTIIASNYAAQALAMASSLKRQSDNADIDVWLIDSVNLNFPEKYFNTINVLKAITEDEFYRLAIKYSILELSTALKPHIIKYYFTNSNLSEVVYIDPDLYFCKSIDSIILSGLNGHDYLLTPHARSPLPSDGKHPNDLDLLKSGAFNLGFIAIKNTATTNEFVSWWLRHLNENCWANPATGVFTDQKWINLAVTYWPNFKVLNEPGLNVAYWNLHERSVSKINNEYFVNDKPLYFFHFSGFIPQEFKLSKHESRIGVIDRDSALGGLTSDYKNLLDKFKYSQSINQKIKVIEFKNEASLDPVITLAAKSYIDGIDDDDYQFDLEKFYAWLTQAQENILNINYIKFLLRLRPDVKNYFEQIGKFDSEHIIQWLRDGGAEECGLDKTTLTEIGVYSRPTLCYLGYVNAMSGVGDATRANIAALSLKRFPIAIEDISSDTIFDYEEHSSCSSAEPSEAVITIAHVNADMLPSVAKRKSALFDRYTIAYMAWETATFPREWSDRNEYCDEVWVPSNFVKHALEGVIQTPVFVMPHPLMLPDKYIKSNHLKRDGSESSVFKFLVSFDACSDLERKNPQSAILAFKLAFGQRPDVQLIIKISNFTRCVKNLSILQDLVVDNKNIVIFPTNFSKEQYLDLIESVDAYVSLHRGEGFGLNIQQAMAMGKPVIVTNYGGNTDFCHSENSILIDYKIVPIKHELSQYPYYTKWADPDVKQASLAMQKIFYDKEFRSRLGINASKDILTNHSLANVASLMQRRIQRISSRIAKQDLSRSEDKDSPSNSSVNYLIKCIFESVLHRSPNTEDISFYHKIYDSYGIERVYRDVILSREGSTKLMIPNYLSKLLRALWAPRRF